VEHLSFEVIQKDAQSSARLGRLVTAHSVIETPVFMPVGTQGTVKALTQEMLEQLDKMRTLYPNLITIKTSIGNSVEGRPIYMVKISDNPDMD